MIDSTEGQMQAEEIKSNLTKRYIVAITLIVFLSTGAFYMLLLALKVSDSTALIVNISGKQRMLSQRVASLSQQYYWHVYVQKNETKAEQARSRLVDAITEMRSANEALSTGHLNPDTKVVLSPQIQAFYYEKIQLKKRVENYLLSAEHLLNAADKESEELHLQELVEVSNPLLKDLNAAVLQYQREGDANIAAINRLEWITWLTTITVLMLEVIFIFEPMANRIRELFQELLWSRENLEEKIAIRTLKLEQANDKLSQLASHDPLTGLKNRLNMERDLEELQMHYHQHGLPYAVIMLDIDWFKKINDTYGHDAGDFVLRELAEIFTENLRTQDSVYRSGGEEFIILLNRIAQDKTREKMEMIRKTVEEHLFVYTDMTLRCTISGGFYHSDMNGGVNAHDTLKWVDEALYQAKESGRNNIVAVSDVAKVCKITES